MMRNTVIDHVYPEVPKRENKVAETVKIKNIFPISVQTIIVDCLATITPAY